VIALVNSQRFEDRNRSKQSEGLLTRAAVAKNLKTQSNIKIGPPNRQKEVVNKKVAFEDSSKENPSVTEKTKTTFPKEKALPYVDVPPLGESLRSLINDRVRDAKIGPAYKSRAPVEAGLDIEKLVEQVLDLEISVPLRNLAGISGAIQKEIRKQVTKARIPVETDENVQQNLTVESRPTIRVDSLPIATYTVMTGDAGEIPAGYFIADDPILQYLETHKGAAPGDLIVAEASEPLRAIYMTINRIGQEECLLDNGSMIVSMSREIAVQLGLTWDPEICINMESASNHIEKTLGLARNVRFSVGGIHVFLQVHILANPPYRVLLGRPFERFTACNSSTKTDGSTDLVLTDPNSKKTAVVPTYPRGQGPEEIQKQKYQGF
jgi:hypothetical protein